MVRPFVSRRLATVGMVAALGALAVASAVSRFADDASDPPPGRTELITGAEP